MITNKRVEGKRETAKAEAHRKTMRRLKALNSFFWEKAAQLTDKLSSFENCIQQTNLFAFDGRKASAEKRADFPHTHSMLECGACLCIPSYFSRTMCDICVRFTCAPHNRPDAGLQATHIESEELRIFTAALAPPQPALSTAMPFGRGRGIFGKPPGSMRTLHVYTWASTDSMTYTDIDSCSPSISVGPNQGSWAKSNKYHITGAYNRAPVRIHSTKPPMESAMCVYSEHFSTLALLGYVRDATVTAWLWYTISRTIYEQVANKGRTILRELPWNEEN